MDCMANLACETRVVNREVECSSCDSIYDKIRRSVLWDAKARDLVQLGPFLPP